MGIPRGQSTETHQSCVARPPRTHHVKCGALLDVGRAESSWAITTVGSQQDAGGTIEGRVHEATHLTLVGHSYGSVVAGMALNDGGNAVVDDYVAYGSPADL